MGKGKIKILTASVVLGLTLSGSVLSGCSLVTTNYEDYYKAIVASATTESGKKIEVTKRDLIQAYNSYGYMYSSYYGNSQEEAIKMTLEQIVSNKLLVEKVENELKKHNNGEILTSKEKKYLWEKTYDSLISNLKSFEETEEEEEAEEETKLTKMSYEKTADLIYNTETGKYEIVSRDDVRTTINKYKFWSDADRDATKKEDKELIYTMLGDFVAGNPEYSNEYKKYLSNLKASEEGQNLSTVNKEVFLREIERLYESNYNSYLTTKYEELYKSSQTNVTANDVVDLYKSYLLEDYTTYALEKSATYSEDILSSAEGMYYTDSNAEFFYVTHILVKFTDEQTALLKKYQEVVDGKGDGQYTIKEAQDGIEELYNGLIAYVRTPDEDGVYTEDTRVSKKNITAGQVLSEVQDAVATNDTNKKAENFYDLMCKYTEDDGTISLKYNYVIGVDYSTPTTDEDGNVTKNYTAHSKMVENFTEEAIRLHDYGNGEVGDVSNELIRTEYGVHILMYAGQIENLSDGICEKVSLNMDLSEEVIVKLDSTRLNVCVDCTYFDLLYDELVADNFSDYQTKDIEYMKSKLKDYNFYYNAYEDLL